MQVARKYGIGAGALRVVRGLAPVVAPGGGAITAEVACPVDRVWRVHSVGSLITTLAVVNNRTAVLAAYAGAADGSYELWRTPGNGNQPASIVDQWCAAPGHGGTQRTFNLPVGGLLIPAGGKVALQLSSVGLGDIIGTLTLLVEEFDASESVAIAAPVLP